MKKSFPWIYFEASVGDQFEKSGFELDGSVDHFNLNPFRPSLLWSKSIAIIIILLLWFHDWNSCMKIRHLVAYLARKLMRNQAVSIKRSIPHCHFIPFPWIFYFSCTIKWFQKFSVALRTAKPSNSVYIWCFNSVHAENMKLVISTSYSWSHKFIRRRIIGNSELPSEVFTRNKNNETRSCYGTQYRIHNLDQTLE